MKEAVQGFLPEGQYISCANGQTIHYLESGSGPAVVWLHGSGPGATGYSNFKGNYLAVAEAGFRSIVVDHPGFGFSSKPQDVDYTLAFFVTCLKQALDGLGVQRCALVGNSLGGAIAIGFALAYPECVDKLVLMAPGACSPMSEYQTMPGIKKLFEVYGRGAALTEGDMAELIREGLVHDARHVTDDLLGERMQAMALQNSHLMATLSIPEQIDCLKDIRCPVLGFWGMDERMMPESGIMNFARNCQNMRLVLLSECGHWVMVEHEAVFNRYCVDFLRNG
ncbi:alpha/beta fold hydrolase [Parahaliea mediterranea]|uniref:alpha/beta fold hydrolase n=1 Tax=Parahaliea mediterranea TaxID=651086 RepID=UPI000E2FEFC5|nr:alpha/beta hydrolase [Parahaliea mediterranea]